LVTAESRRPSKLTTVVRWSAQRQQITGYAMIKGLAIDDFFVEPGVWGSVPLGDRVEGMRMLAMAGAGDMIVIAKLDRAFRSAIDALDTLEKLKAAKVALHMIDLGGDVTGNGSAAVHASTRCLRPRAPRFAALSCAPCQHARRSRDRSPHWRHLHHAGVTPEFSLRIFGG
jgi:Resolvase, N terminal domain